MKKIYLDYNIWDEMNKKSETKFFFQSLKDVEYYISVAHFEELLHARNNEDELHNGCSNELRNLMLSMSISGMIIYNATISFDPNRERLRAAVQSIEIEHNTQELMTRISEREFNNRDEETKKGYKGMEGVKTEDLYMRIWDDPIIIQKISEKNDKANKLLQFIKNKIITPYNAIQTMPIEWRKEYENEDGADFLAFRNILSQTKEIKKGCYNEIKGDCVCLETIIDVLNSFLLDIGFNQDTKIRTYISGKYDLQHFILSTYCDVFISKDKHFCERAKAIAYYLGIPLDVKLWKNGQLT